MIYLVVTIKNSCIDTHELKEGQYMYIMQYIYAGPKPCSDNVLVRLYYVYQCIAVLSFQCCVWPRCDRLLVYP